jgi:hypothetical protein
MTKAEKCIAWFNERGIRACSPTHDDTVVMITVGKFNINVSDSEIEYRALLYDYERGGMA